MATPMSNAAAMVGRGEVPDRGAIQEYLRNGGTNLDPVTTAWCAAFVNASLGKAGLPGTGSNMARSFLNYGTPTAHPQQGDIAVFSRGDPNGPQGHVGFFNKINPDGTINILAGNQGDAVSYGNQSPASLLGYRHVAAPGTPGIYEEPAPLPGMGGMVTPTQSQIPIQPIDPYVPMTPERFFQQMIAGNNPLRQMVFHRIGELLS